MTEYIEREKAIKFVQKHMTDVNTQTDVGNGNVVSEVYDIAISHAIDYLRFVPAADVVEVIRCKTCKHFTEGMAVGICKRVASKPIIPIPYNHFCSFGERRAEE